jgi:hypothetical protein
MGGLADASLRRRPAPVTATRAAPFAPRPEPRASTAGAASFAPRAAAPAHSVRATSWTSKISSWSPSLMSS